MGLAKYFEWTTIIGASIILGVLSYFAAVYLYQIDYLGYSSSNPEYEVITVEAGQYYWKFIYPNGTTSSVLKIKAGKLYKLEMYSKDVIHSLFVPELGYKFDVFPNYKTTMWIKIDKPGTYNIYCAEYCGTYHYAMLSRIVVM
ncbi:MAG: cytochrome c oxidase subunit II [Thermoproteota archaeon]|jgi:cytochrome aa3-600 menaquinol oxidase subunit 2